MLYVAYYTYGCNIHIYVFNIHMVDSVCISYVYINMHGNVSRWIRMNTYIIFIRRMHEYIYYPDVSDMDIKSTYV